MGDVDVCGAAIPGKGELTMWYTTMLVTLAFVAGGAGMGSGGGAMPDTKEAVLRDSSGAEVGKVTLREAHERIQLRVEVHGLPPGQHGMHLHEAGRCEGPGFQTAGGHLNPGGTMRHGHKNPQGPHLGDLGNLTVGEDRKADKTVEVSGAEARLGFKTFLGMGQNGLTLVVHANVDDELTDPSGNSGADRLRGTAVGR
jgi:superoxide dismutase, Cu-Zn family